MRQILLDTTVSNIFHLIRFLVDCVQFKITTDSFLILLIKN